MNNPLVLPNPFRLRYRRELAATISAIVWNGQSADETAIRAVLPATVKREDEAKFVALTLAEFKTIHSGNAIRFGITPHEFSVWNGGVARRDRGRQDESAAK